MWWQQVSDTARTYAAPSARLNQSCPSELIRHLIVPRKKRLALSPATASYSEFVRLVREYKDAGFACRGAIAPVHPLGVEGHAHIPLAVNRDDSS